MSDTKCYVIMPFSKTTYKHTEDYWNWHYNDFLKPEIERGKDICVRRSIPLHGDILSKIILDLIESDIVVADLTDFNPNVFWELGVRHSFTPGTIIIAEQGTHLPFDISGNSILFYEDSSNKAVQIDNTKFTEDLNRAIEYCISNPDESDSEVLDTIHGRGPIYELIHRKQTIRRLNALGMEISLNKELCKEIDTIAKDIIDKDSKMVFSSRFSTPAIELFLTECYIQAEDDLMLGNSYMLKIREINQQLDSWRINMKAIAQWLPRELILLIKFCDSFLKRIDENIARLKSLK